ncbi:MAG TPA: hypothetical protein VGH92_10595, partial [Gaiellaceae bacterium]
MRAEYAGVATANPYGIVAVRTRGLKYWWASISIALLGTMYASPLVTALLRPGAFPRSVSTLPAVSIPAVVAPVLRVPTLHSLPPLPQAKTSASAAKTAHAPATRAVRRRVRVPVVADHHTQIVAAAKPAKTLPDPFAKAPTVADDVGDLGNVPSAALASTSPPSAPPTTSADGTPQYQFFSASSDDPSTTSSSAPPTVTAPGPQDVAPPTPPPTMTVTVGSPEAGTVTGTVVSTQTTTTGEVGASGGGMVDPSVVQVAGTTDADPKDAGVVSTSSTAVTGDGSATDSTGSAAVSAGTSSDGPDIAVVDGVQATESDGASAAPAGADAQAPDPTTGTASGLAPPSVDSDATQNVTAAAGGTVTSADGNVRLDFPAGAVPADVTVAITPISASATDGLVYASSVYDFSATGAAGQAIHQFAVPVLLTIAYDPTKGGAPTVYYLDPNGPAVPLATTVDGLTDTASASIQHFSDYVIGVPVDVSQLRTGVPVVETTIDGTVSDSAGALAGVTVEGSSDTGYTVDGTTDATGAYSLGVTRGLWTISVGSVSGHETPLFQTVDTTVPGFGPVDFSLDSYPVTVSGHTLDDSGNPLPGVSVTNGTDTAVSGGDGSFTLG